VSYVPGTENYTDYVISEVPSMREVEQEVREMVNVPKSVMTAVEIEEPKEIQKTIIEMIAQVK